MPLSHLDVTLDAKVNLNRSIVEILDLVMDAAAFDVYITQASVIEIRK